MFILVSQILHVFIPKHIQIRPKEEPRASPLGIFNTKWCKTHNYSTKYISINIANIIGACHDINLDLYSGCLKMNPCIKIYILQTNATINEIFKQISTIDDAENFIIIYIVVNKKYED